ncbi:MAG: peptidylprolyl isomerase [Lewinella sp.]|jgi:peptidyl-prolyl cis-trans isomerase B (cyclophilin B)|uniref:peptidylprolyl isomerase n=1 Tax=Lewinella sp. TaxID=2004506 RepID=UPI003D6A53F2
MHKVILYLAALLLVGSCARPIADFSVPTEDIAAAKTLTFSNEPEEGLTYFWDFGDGQTSTEVSPEHRFLGSGTYTVKLTATDEKGKTGTKEKKVTVLAPERCLVLIQTPMGDMLAEIYDRTPLHQDNFVKMIEQGYYDSLLFHRVIQGFMIQGGDPDSRNAAPGKMLGSGGPGYTIKAEFVDSLAHVKGALSAARTNNPQKRSSGSQFYIVQGKPVSEQDLNNKEGAARFRYPSYVREEYLKMGGTPFLDQEYTVFGQVIEGLDVIDRIAAVNTNGQNRPNEDVWMVIKLIR